MKLEAKASIQIQKPAGDVFEGIVNPGKMTKYLIPESSGRMESGRKGPGNILNLITGFL